MDVYILILAICYASFAIVGVTGNTIMLISTRNRKLRSVCHYLICSLCLADLLHLLSQFPCAATLIAEVEFPQYYCLYGIVLPVIGAVCSSLICMAMGIDRLIAVLFPHFYSRIQQYTVQSLLAYFLIPAAYTSWIVFVAFQTSTDELIKVCIIPSAMNPKAFSLFTYSTVIIDITICAIYLITWILIRRKSFGLNFRKIFASITLTVMLIVFGWFSTMLVNSASYLFIEDAYTRKLVQMYAGIFVNSAASANIFVYYNINADYREAIRATLYCSKIKNSDRSRSVSSKHFGQPSQVAPNVKI